MGLNLSKRLRATAGIYVAALMGLSLLSPPVFAASPQDEKVPPGIDESEYNRLRRPTSWRNVPEFLSPEAMKGLSSEVVEAIQRDFTRTGRIQVQSERYLDYDEEHNIIYSNARTRIRFDRFMLEADRVLVNVPLQEIQAEGNVVLRAWRDAALTSKESEIHCKSLIFNYKYFQGAAYEARGQYGYVYFKCAAKEGDLPAFRLVGRDEVIFRNVDVTTCDFPDPQYFIRTRDAVLIANDRFFFQRATLYVRHIPVLYLPAYTKSLREKFPWHITFGRSSRLGTYVNIGYNFWHYRYEPSFENDNKLELRDRGHGRLKLDLFSKRGVGMGLDYSYSFDLGKHRGELHLYGMPSDRYRDVEGDRTNSRWQIFARHRSQLSRHLILQADVDYMSDPEFYYDLRDDLTDIERGRVPERRARAALTWWKEDYIARALFEVKQRITRDRITNTAEPWDDDFDYDYYPEEDWIHHHHDNEGIPSSRYGLVSLRLPQLTFSTRHIRIGGMAPLFYTLDVNAFNNLDKGLNFRSTRDDSFVLGIDIYQQLSYLFKFSERYTLLAQIGAGIGAMQRLDDSYHWRPSDFVREDGTLRTDISYVDKDTFRINRGGREVSLSDYQPAFIYGDVKLRFQGRFTDSLTGNIYYILREGTDDSLSEFYESIGNRTARADLYNYRTRKHWISADLTYRLAHPDISMTLAAGRNLQSRSDIYPNEPIQFASFSTNYRNQARTFRLTGYVRYDQRQIRDPSDPDEYRRDEVTAGLDAAYAPPHRRWWIDGNLYVWKALNSDPADHGRRKGYYEEDYYRDIYADDYYYYREDRMDVHLETWIGRKLGQKWTVELGTEYQRAYSGIRNARLILTRDLHNALAQVSVRYKRRPWKDSSRDVDVNFNIRFKLPGPVDTVQAPNARVLMDERRQLELAEDSIGI